ncbi:MAG: SUMF1/EgtB/PvdO family nonheme iron enzyme [Myxococcales bacterium]|nr:SUMF1/EgtB/PvdO family nonheme iron enzyme [Myxococcales bacterium]
MRSAVALVLVAACADKAEHVPPPSPPPPVDACAHGSVLVAGGTFQMGSPDGVGAEDEYPQHDVAVASFCLDRTEVTVAAYAACAAAGACPPPPKPYAPCNANFADRGDHPMNCIDWTEAQAVCAWSGGRLPTEAEWEYAARGGDRRTYPWGEAPPDGTRLNACGADCAAKLTSLGHARTSEIGGDDGHSQTAPVGSYPQGASAAGALDMAGNVWEWTADLYAPYGPGGTCRVEGQRVVRGGAWTTAERHAFRVARRWSGEPGRRSVELGARCARGTGSTPPSR